LTKGNEPGRIRDLDQQAGMGARSLGGQNKQSIDGILLGTCGWSAC